MSQSVQKARAEALPLIIACFYNEHIDWLAASSFTYHALLLDESNSRRVPFICESIKEYAYQRLYQNLLLSELMLIHRLSNLTTVVLDLICEISKLQWRLEDRESALETLLPGFWVPKSLEKA